MADFDFKVHNDVMVEMRDGVCLATDLYLPVAEGPSPTLLTRTPYDKTLNMKAGRPREVAFAQAFAKRGYAVVVQAVRGRYNSEGVWRMLNDDAHDVTDTCAWIGKQAWSDGQVGMFGTSYPGGLQHIAAMANVPELTTVIPVDAVSNMGKRGMRYGGAYELRFYNWVMTGGNDESWLGVDTPARAPLSEMSKHRIDYLERLPLRPGTTPLKHVPEYESWLIEAMDTGTDDDFWSLVPLLDETSRYKDIPVSLVGGWYDSWDGNTTANYVALSKALKSSVHLTMGPWIHGQQGVSAHGQVEFGAEAAIADQFAWRLEWFDKWMKDADNSVGRSGDYASPVRIFVMGTGDGSKTADGRLFHGGFWRDEQEWPLARTQYTPFYLKADGTLSASKPDVAESSTTFDFDPSDPVPSIGGNVSSAEGILVQGAWDQRGSDAIWNWTKPLPLSARNDVLVFQTEPLEADVEVTGELEVKLWVSSSAVDTDFTAKLIDVYPANEDFPGGFDLNIEDGILRCRFRESLKSEKLMTPGEVYEITIHLYPTSNVFKAGHRIRLDISSSNFPRFDVNPNTGEPLNRHRQTVMAQNTVFHDAARASHIVLPIIPA